jgi:hypothetical protein
LSPGEDPEGTFLDRGPGDRLGLGAAVAVERRPDAGRRQTAAGPVRARTKRRPFSWSQGSAQARIRQSCWPGTRQRFSGFSQPRQCGDDVLRMLVTGGPPVRGGGGMPQRIIASSRPVSVLRTTGAG